MRFLPEAVREKVVWEIKQFDGKSLVFRRWFDERTKLLVNWEDPDSRRPQANLLNEEGEARSENKEDNFEGKDRRRIVCTCQARSGRPLGAPSTCGE